MIPNRADDVQVLNNITSDATGQFTVDESSLGKIMSVLTNLYSDPEMAVVREYLTNAYDAQVDAGMVLGDSWRPIEVTTPSHFSKEYKVRDFGIGLSVDDIKEVYSKYGKSTKESSNDVTGMLGLGSKCALTYTGQFTITGYKNGVRVRAVVSKDDNDIPVFMIVDTRATDEPNGVEISVPVRDRNTFEEKAQEFLRWWPKGSVILNGQDPTGHDLSLAKNDPMTFNIAGGSVTANVPVYTWGADNINRYSLPPSYIIMGNVPYVVDPEYVSRDLRDARMGFVAYVPMGAVDFPPSREKLFYNKRTKAVIDSISDGLFNAILDKRLAEVTSAPDHRTAWQSWRSLPGVFRGHPRAQGLKYKGDDISLQIVHESTEIRWDWQNRGLVSERRTIPVDAAMKGALIVTGVRPDVKLTTTFKKKVRHYMDANALGQSLVFLVDSDVTSPWLSWVPRVDAPTISSLKLPRDTTASKSRTEAPYEFYTHDSNGYVVKDEAVSIPVSPGKTLVHISPTDMRETYRRGGITPEDFLQHLGDDYILVVMGKNRFGKFLKSHKSIPASRAVQLRMADLDSKTTGVERLLGDLSYEEKRFLTHVNPDDLKDSDLAGAARIAQGPASPTAHDMMRGLQNAARGASIHVDIPNTKKIDNPCKRYPLIGDTRRGNIGHLVEYCNAIYQHKHQADE